MNSNALASALVPSLLLWVTAMGWAQTSSPATVSATSVDAYLDMCVAGIEQWPTPESPRVLPSMHDVARCLLYVRGSERDRAQALRLIDVEPPQSAKVSPARRASSKRYMQIAMRAALGERESLVGEIEQFASDGPVQTFTPQSLEAGILYGLAGQNQRALELIDPSANETAASMLAEAGRIDLLDRLLDRPVADASRDHLAAVLIGCGRIEQGFAMAEGTSRLDLRARHFDALAAQLDEVGRPDLASRAFDRGIAAWDAMGDSTHPPISPLEWLNRHRNDRAAAIFERWQRTLSPVEKRQTYDWATLGEYAATFGPMDVFDASLVALRAAPVVDGQGRADFSLAAVLAAGGQIDAAMAAFDRARLAAPAEDLVASETFSRLTAALRRRGETARALELTKRMMPEKPDRAFELVQCVAAYVRAGDPTTAWATASEIDGLMGHAKMRARLIVLLELERSGRRAEALRLLATLQEPAERAPLALFVARDSQGTRLLGLGGLTLLK